ncbi:MAG: RNA polymerase sigma factor RpoH [Rickettsiales bacterium]|nr:RNA polymerase sigma factor RpoH [Rickettsiales bacterium]
MNRINLPAIQENGLSAYIEQVNKFPVLDEKEEFMLATRFKEHNDVTAAHKLVTSHLRLVVKIAMSFRGYGLPISDIISEGNIGLMTAVKKFDASKGFRLSTYAMWWIKASINEFILKSWSIVKMGSSATQKKLFYNLKRLKNQLLGDSSAVNMSDANTDEIADALDVSAEEVRDMDMLMSNKTQSLNTFMGEDSEDEKINFIEDKSDNQEVTLANNQELNFNKNLLAKAFENLNERERDIIKKRRLLENPKTLDDLSNLYGISRERVRQIENRALEKLQNFMLPLAKQFQTS